MESKKLSKTVLKRLRKKGIIQPCSTDTAKKLSEDSTSSGPKIKQIKSEKVPNVEANDKSTAVTSTGKRHPKHYSKHKVTHPNTNYVSKDTPNIGRLIRDELVGLKQQSKNIQSASDLTENQAHVIKRQITRLHGETAERVFKPPKRYDKTIGKAADELAELLEKQKANMVSNSKRVK